MSVLEDRIPVLSKSDLTPAQLQRIENLTVAFKNQFSIEPGFFARSPGRVNLIGEHVDYSSYSVLPMAIQKDTIIAVAPYDGNLVQLANINPKFPFREFEHVEDGHAVIDASKHEWSNYFKCGYKGVLDTLNLEKVKGLKVMVDGTVPTGGGLSSSSAFVCCSALATLIAQSKTMNKGELTATAIKSETLAGVEIGGMDQSISIMANKGSALLIDFYPRLFATEIKIPKDAVFVIANTCVTADKHTTAPTNYNLRVVEVRLASAILAKKLGLKLDGIPTLKKVQEAHVGLETPIENLSTMLELVEKHLKKGSYKLDEIAGELDMSVEELSKKYIGSIKIKADGFKLYQRSKHVFSESQRVYKFQHCESLEQLGGIMSESHASCRELFECSCPELDELTALARKSGALGSRLTGAGWGGCTVSLVHRDNVDKFIEDVKNGYFVPRGLSGNEDMLFATEPSIGAYVLQQ